MKYKIAILVFIFGTLSGLQQVSAKNSCLSLFVDDPASYQLKIRENILTPSKLIFAKVTKKKAMILSWMKARFDFTDVQMNYLDSFQKVTLSKDGSIVFAFENSHQKLRFSPSDKTYSSFQIEIELDGPHHYFSGLLFGTDNGFQQILKAQMKRYSDGMPDFNVSGNRIVAANASTVQLKTAILALIAIEQKEKNGLDPLQLNSMKVHDVFMLGRDFGSQARNEFLASINIAKRVSDTFAEIANITHQKWADIALPRQEGDDLSRLNTRAAMLIENPITLVGQNIMALTKYTISKDLYTVSYEGAIERSFVVGKVLSVRKRSLTDNYSDILVLQTADGIVEISLFDLYLLRYSEPKK